jgi:ribonuclease E
MLIDASHPEETRVVVVDGTRLEEFDFETASRKALKGNIYLAKVIRIEPSLQAAFVEYGGNRHGFLAFSEIHPDYYQIPVADRERLIAEQQRMRADADDYPEPPRRHSRVDRTDIEEARADLRSEPAAEEPAEGAPESAGEPRPGEEVDPHDRVEAAASSETTFVDEIPSAPVTAQEPDRESAETASVETVTAQAATIEHDHVSGPALTEETRLTEAAEIPAALPDAMLAIPAEGSSADASATESSPVEVAIEVTAAEEVAAAESVEGQIDGQAEGQSEQPLAASPADPSEAPQPEVSVETLGGDDSREEGEARERRRRYPSVRQYKIQEVIKRRQILLVQVVKEERGNKGAALTTYLSLAGRYCVLMPNAGRGGGISRKISNPSDRKRMKEMLAELDVPQGMGVILRTAGLERSKIDIKRDYEYLSRLWDSIRELTMRSTAPALIYEEGDLIKRSLRDIYDTDIAQVLVEGEAGFKAASEFMRQLVPHQANKVELYREGIPLFHRYQVESQFDAMHSPVVQLRSGGYIVINPTEALVAIDVNSGRSTKERNIEETAVRTNVEAAEEIARQVRLRDLAGLIVIDFIDMEESRHQRQVEHKVKDSMRTDRARIQIGRISAFGLLELSRQRLRPSLLEHSTEICPHCAGIGRIRSIESAALHALRNIEEEGVRHRASEIAVSVPPNVALYLLNQKRHTLSDIEKRYGFTVLIEADEDMHAADCEIERLHARREDQRRPAQELARASYDEGDRDEAPHADDGAEGDGEVEHESHDGARGESQAPLADGESETQEGGRRRRRRRRRRTRGDGEGPIEGAVNGDASSEHAEDHAGAEGAGSSEGGEGEGEFAGEANGSGEGNSGEEGSSEGDRGAGDAAGADRRRRRGRRGGRRRRREDGEIEGSDSTPRDHAANDTNGSEPARHDDAAHDLESRSQEPRSYEAERHEAGNHGHTNHESPGHEQHGHEHNGQEHHDHASHDHPSGDHKPAEHAPSDYAPRPHTSYDPGPPVNVEAAVPPPPVPVFVAAPPPEPVMMQAPPPPPEPTPDPIPTSIVPAISADAPPEKPKRGWWRR